MADPYPTRTDAREIAGPCAAEAYGYNCEHTRARSTVAWHGEPPHTCHPCLIAREIASALAAERERVLAACAAEIDGPCGLDALNHGMTCAPIVPGGRVYHESRCRREDADAIRALGAAPTPAGLR